MAADRKQWSLNDAKTSHLIPVSLHLSLFFDVFDQLKFGLYWKEITKLFYNTSISGDLLNQNRS